MALADLTAEFDRAELTKRQQLPAEYLRLSDEVMAARLTKAKAALGSRLLILGHHYQRDEVIRFADVTGDSLKLSQHAAAHHQAEFVVFCGVHFMAESANVLGGAHQKVMLPDLAAGCSMADMAAIDQLEVCWEEMGRLAASSSQGAAKVIPVTYINSAAAIKAFCGEHDGIVCTSSNAAAVMAWGWDEGDKVLMLPDQHLGRNTAYRMGVPLDEMVLWDPDLPYGGVDAAAFAKAKLILWKGHCSVHTRFSVAQIDHFRKTHPSGRVIVHPECTFDVVRAADEVGSTDFIRRTVKASEPGSIWAVGTEVHLVNRLASEVAPERTVLTLDSVGCLCSTMFRISPNHLLWTLDGLVAGEVRNQIVVPEPARTNARIALERMLECRP